MIISRACLPEALSLSLTAQLYRYLRLLPIAAGSNNNKQEIQTLTDNQTLSAALPDPIDVSIGARLRLRRLSMGFSQETLARELGITLQQIQRAEEHTFELQSLMRI